ncbi:MAG: hypothetical protein HOW97_02930 [Catenulispora sp.]|nr:hypothetical protein [Catenulispora sp.]
MNPTPTAPPETGGLTESLTARGWIHTKPMSLDPQWRSVRESLEDPDGRLHLDAAVYPDGHLVAHLSAEATRSAAGGLITPGWMADLSEWPREAILAAITAATAEPEPDLPDTLKQAGWEQLADIRQAGRLLERSWTSPDGSASLTWAPADDHDLGGWGVIREIDGERLEANASQHTPPAILTALALTAANTTE